MQNFAMLCDIETYHNLAKYNIDIWFTQSDFGIDV